MEPNILWILTTQWRAQALGSAGDGNARTPFLDALAAEGVTYTQAVTPHPFGPFARAAILTGVESPANGVRDYFDPLPAESRTTAHAMRARGYETAFFGKWHLGRRDPSDPLTGDAHARSIVPPGHRGGFDFWEGFESGFLLNDPWLHGSRLPVPVQVKGYQSDIVCERARAVLAGCVSPWFAVVSLEAPHPPYGAPAAGVHAVDPASIVLRGNVPASAAPRARQDLSGYYAHIQATDRALGALIAGLPKETIVVFTSVHGDMHGSHGLFRKGWPHEESVRVPLIIRSALAPGRDERSFSLTELHTLTAGWADRGPDAVCPDTAPDGGFSRISMPSVVALADQCDRPWKGLRSARRKLVLNADGSPWLLFDLERDPLERFNLADDPSRAAEIELLRGRIS